MRTRTVIANMVLVLFLGCGRAGTPLASPAGEGNDARSAARLEWQAAARIAAERGDHLGASRYLEAALAAGGDELHLLPLLAAAQIRAGRLRAARSTIACLEELDPDRPGLRDLNSLIDSLIDPAAVAAAAVPGTGGAR